LQIYHIDSSGSHNLLVDPWCGYNEQCTHEWKKCQLSKNNVMTDSSGNLQLKTTNGQHTDYCPVGITNGEIVTAYSTYKYGNGHNQPSYGNAYSCHSGASCYYMYARIKVDVCPGCSNTA
jgi:hypothetical protein